jgi:hypothetical protein
MERKIKEKPIEIKYTYLKPTSQEEREDAQRRLNRAFDVLFGEVLKKNPKFAGSNNPRS